jgi:hypothetical protein
LVKLVYKDEVVGCRAYIGNDVLDMDLDAFKKLHTQLTIIPRSAELKSVGLLLLTDDEVNSKVHARDISSDTNQLNRVKDALPAYLNSLKPVEAMLPNAVIPQVNIKTKREPKNSLTFSRGFCLLLVSIHEDASEYQVIKLEHVVDIVFAEKGAIVSAGRLLWGQLHMKKALKEFSGGKRIFRVRLFGDMLWKLHTEFGVKLHVLQEGYLHTYLNHHSGMRYKLQLKPPNFIVNLSQFGFEPRLGPAVDGVSLEDYLSDLRDESSQEVYSYHPSLSMTEVRAQWVKLNI